MWEGAYVSQVMKETQKKVTIKRIFEISICGLKVRKKSRKVINFTLIFSVISLVILNNLPLDPLNLFLQKKCGQKCFQH